MREEPARRPLASRFRRALLGALLAAATTDVGYRMTVRETTTGKIRTYENPVGRAAPALLDLQAFSCLAAGAR